MALAPGVRLGPYAIAAQIGVGGMGEVWKAKDTRLGREVAIEPLPEVLKRSSSARDTSLLVGGSDGTEKVD